jgi:hypothetical protein
VSATLAKRTCVAYTQASSYHINTRYWLRHMHAHPKAESGGQLHRDFPSRGDNYMDAEQRFIEDLEWLERRVGRLWLLLWGAFSLEPVCAYSLPAPPSERSPHTTATSSHPMVARSDRGVFSPQSSHSLAFATPSCPFTQPAHHAPCPTVYVWGSVLSKPQLRDNDCLGATSMADAACSYVHLQITYFHEV